MKHLRIMSLVLLLALLAACGGTAPVPEVEPQAVLDTEATATIEPEASATVTRTPAATPTLAATATVTRATATPAVAAPEMAESCAEPEVTELVARLRQAIATENEEDLAALIHPQRGLTVRMAWWNPPVTFSGEAAASLLSDTTSHDWGIEDGSGFAITGSFAEVALPPLHKDLVEAREIGCGEILHGATAGLVQLPPEDEGLDYVSLYRPAPPDVIEFDWGTWVVGYEEWQGEPRMTTLIYYRYEI
jgi:hypothetical protein